MRIKRNPDADLYEVKFGNKDLSPVTLYTSKTIGLPHGERILFDGFITKFKGKEADFLPRRVGRRLLRNVFFVWM